MSQNIEIKPMRRVSVTDENQWKTLTNQHSTFGETPGGSKCIYGTTPGGTRIIYDRLYLLAQKDSPLSCTPPKLPHIPGVTNINSSLTEHNNQGMNTIVEQDELLSNEKNQTTETSSGSNENLNQIRFNGTDSPKNEKSEKGKLKNGDLHENTNYQDLDNDIEYDEEIEDMEFEMEM